MKLATQDFEESGPCEWSPPSVEHCVANTFRIVFKLGFGVVFVCFVVFFFLSFYLCHQKYPEAGIGVQCADKLSFREQDTATFQFRTTVRRKMTALPYKGLNGRVDHA